MAPERPDLCGTTSCEQYPAVRVAEDLRYINLDVLFTKTPHLGSLTVDVIRKGCNGVSGPNPGNSLHICGAFHTTGDGCGGCARTKLRIGKMTRASLCNSCASPRGM